MVQKNVSDHIKDKTAPEDKYPTKRGFIGYFFYYAGMLATHLFIKFRIKGKKNIPSQSPYVIAANHQTYVDGLWIASGLPKKHFRKMCCLAGSDLETSHGSIGRIIMHVGRGIAIDRYGNPVRGLIKAKKEIGNGYIMLIHPEGTRTPDGKIGELKDGAAYLSVKAAVPLLPVFVEGGYQVFSRHMKYPKPWDREKKRRKRVTIHFGNPLNPQDFHNNAHELTDGLRDWMHEQEKKFSDIPLQTIPESV